MFLVCGEALFDFFLHAERGPGAATYEARAGGSPFNVAIGLSRLGETAGLFTGLSTDLLGARLRGVLENEGVSTRHAVVTDRPTTISLVGLDTAGVPAYQFYDQGSAGTGLGEADLPRLDDVVRGLHFGSYSIAATPVGDAHAALAASASGRFVSLDPNVRPTVEPDMDIWRERIAALRRHVGLLKVSREDLDMLYPGKRSDACAADAISDGVDLVVVTDGHGAARAWTADGVEATATPPAVEVVDTVGAGDTFQAALISRIIRRSGAGGLSATGMDASELSGVLDFCARAAAITCSRRGADLPRAAELEK